MLKYRDEKDKSYGVVGMAIAMHVWDADEMYGSVTLDADGFDCVRFAGEYYYAPAADGVSPRAAFHHSIKIFKIMMGLALSNVMCRTIVGDGGNLSAEDSREIKDIFINEAYNQYAITAEECNAIYDKSYRYLNRLYNYSQVHELVHRMAESLVENRTLSQLEVADYLTIIQ